MDRSKLVKGNLYKVVANTGGHEFFIGEQVRFSHMDDDDEIVCYHKDGSDYWYMYDDELEEV